MVEDTLAPSQGDRACVTFGNDPPEVDMLTKFDKAIATTITAGGSAYALLSSSCSSVLAVFGTHSGTAQILSSILLGVAAGGITWLVPNKK